MADGDHVIGKNTKPYINTGTVAAPTWVLMDHFGNLTVNMQKGEAEIADREIGWEMTGGGRKRGSISGDYLHEKGSGDATFTKLMDSYMNDTPNEFAFLDQDSATTGAQGLRAPMIVTTLDQNQDLDNAVMYSVELKVTRMMDAGSIVAPSWMTV